MIMYALFKSVLDQDRAPIVLCNLEHKIVYMNLSAIKRYDSYGGEKLIGKSLLDCHNGKSCEIIQKVLAWFSESKENNMLYTSRNEKENKDIYMVALRNADGVLIGYYEKHEYRNTEMADLYDFSKSLISF